MLLPLFFFFLLLLNLHLSSSSSISFPDFQIIDVLQPLTVTGTGTLPDFNNTDESKYTLRLLHRDRFPSVSYRNHHHRLHARLRRDTDRVAAILRRISGKTVPSGSKYEVDDFGSDVVSGMDQGSGEYFVRIGVGSPPRDQYMVIDSGSDMVWVQCQPCKLCYKQSDPVFDPAKSGSYTGVSCGTVIRNVAMGCGHRNRGMFVGAAGLLGIGGGSMSFVGQLTGQTGGAFGYCLVSRGTDSTGSLVFGREALPVGASIALPDDVFDLTETGDGGVVMDTGTAVTRLPTAAYAAFRDGFKAQTANLPRASGVSIFDTCYDLSGFVSVRVPTVSFYFTEGPVLTLPARNFLMPVDDSGTYCFAFAASPTGLSIIGNIQQEGIQVSFDGANGFVGFGPNVC
ncbi:BnaA05g19130D [Brassica napus]|uniref:BnaA05g19130D protein n=1 Tax=Brassica napus TaxID=3708 RepID=A0A078GJ05_BRANA|nr:BnaA05g19130D [Brassica napus]